MDAPRRADLEQPDPEAGTAVLTALEAVRRLEAELCGADVASSAAEAEGLAVAGFRAASVSDGRGLLRAGTFSALPASCVHHVLGDPGEVAGGTAFELAASGAQEAVDLAVAGHLLSLHLARPGVCRLGADAESRLDLVRMPAPALLEDGFESSEAREPEATPARIVELTALALEAVVRGTGRARSLVHRSGASDAGVALVSLAPSAPVCVEASGELTARGVPCAAVAVHLVRPFPEDAIRDALSGVGTVVAACAEDGRLVRALRATLDPSVRLVSVAAADAEGLVASIGADLDIPGAPSSTLPAQDSRTLIVSPPGSWAQEFARKLLEVFDHVAGAEPGALRTGLEGVRVTSTGGPAAGTDVLVAAHDDPALLLRAVPRLREGGVVVLLSDAGTEDDLLERLGDDLRAELVGHGLHLAWISPEEGGGDATVGHLCGAAVAALVESSGQSWTDAMTAAASGDDAQEAIRIAEGAGRVHSADDALRRPVPPPEVDFRATSDRASLRATDETPASSNARVRAFHRSGRSPFDLPDASVDVAAAALLGRALREAAEHPALLLSGDGEPLSARGLCDVLSGALAGAPEVEPHRGRLVTGVAGRLDGAVLLDAMADAGAALAGELGLEGAERTAWDAALAQAASSLPSGTRALGVDGASAIRLHLDCLRAVRAPAREAFSAHAIDARERLDDLLRLDRAHAGADRDPATLGSALGAVAGMLDLDKLASVPPPSASDPLAPERRQRIADASAGLAAWLDGQPSLPEVLILHPPGLDLDLPVPADCTFEHPDPMVAALGVFDGMARRMVPVVCHSRIAELEVVDRWRDDVHPAALASLDWEGLDAVELSLLPVVVVVTTGARVRGGGEAGLARLLGSGRPVQVIVLDDIEDAVTPEGTHEGLGWLAVGHREALVVQSSVARPSHLVSGLLRVAAATRPALAVVSGSSAERASDVVLRTEAALFGRTAPLLVYDPDGGADWGDRLDLSGNPQPERLTPVMTLPCVRGDDDEDLEIAITHADAMALDPAFRDHFRLLAAEDEALDQVPMDEWLDKVVPGEAIPWLPYVPALDDEGAVRRLLVTRELAVVCLDRRRAWRVLHELAGHDNAHATAAADAARQAAEQDAEERAGVLEEEHRAELEKIRTDTARESLERLATALMDVDTALPSGRPAPAPASPAADPAAPAVADAPTPAPVEEEEDEGLALDDPYIDTMLCTSCNECTNLNNRLFLYNADKQAYMGDPTAGTFAELVRAAELCPANCIHVGKPRAGDATATAEVVERASAYP